MQVVVRFFFLQFFRLWALKLTIFPLRLFVWHGKCLGFLLHTMGFRKRIVRENLERAFPEKMTAEIDQLVHEQYFHIGQLVFEFIRSFCWFQKFLADRCTYEGVEHLHAARALGKGVLVMTAHLGNWEVLPSHGTSVLKFPVTMVTKRLKPEWFHEMIVAMRAKLGTRMAFEPKTMQIVIRALRQNEIVGFAIDQFAGAPVGARVPFFNIPVGTNTVLAVLAHRTGAPVIPGFALRKPGGGFHIIYFPPIPLTKCSTVSAGYTNAQEEEIIKDTAKFNLCLEELVRKYPAQWLWIHRRWKGNLSPLPSNLVGEMMKPD